MPSHVKRGRRKMCKEKQVVEEIAQEDLDHHDALVKFLDENFYRDGTRRIPSYMWEIRKRELEERERRDIEVTEFWIEGRARYARDRSGWRRIWLWFIEKIS